MSTQEELEAERFIHRGMQYLKTTFPEQTAEMDDEVLKNKLIDGCQRALSHGFETEADVMLLVDFLWRLPDGAAESSDYEWMDEILSSDDMDNEMKIDALYNAFAITTAVKEDEANGKEL